MIRTTQVERARVDRRHHAVEDIKWDLAKLYRGFVAWASLYGDVDNRDERERRERVVELLDRLHNCYLPRSLWLTEGNRKKMEGFFQRAEELCSEFSAAIEEQGYEKARARMAKRVSKKLGPLKKDVEADLEAGLSQPSRPGWRERIRG